MNIAFLHSEKYGRLYTGQIEAVDLTKGQYHINFLQPGIESCWVSDIDVMVQFNEYQKILYNYLMY